MTHKKMFHNDDAFKHVMWCRALMIMTSQTRLDRNQFEANKLLFQINITKLI